MASDSYMNEQLYKVLGSVFNRRQQGKPRAYRPPPKGIGPRSKSLVFSDKSDPYGNKISPTSPDHVGHWAHAKAGDKPPLGAIQAPDKFNSYICVWPEKDYSLGRGSDGPHTSGLDAWFPFGGWEYSAKDYSIRFDILVDDGKDPGLYSWIKVCRLAEQDSYKPVLVHGMSPMVVNNVLGKGSTEYLTAWTCEAGTEKEHNKDEILRALVLCVKQPRVKSDRGWREIHIHEPVRITDNMIRSEVIAQVTQIGNNIDDKAKALKISLKYTSEEGQNWVSDEPEKCAVPSTVKSENCLRKLAEAKLPIGFSLYGTDQQTITIDQVEITRNYEVPPHTQMTVTLSVHRQEVVLDLPAQEFVFSKDGMQILQRQVTGTWKAVSTKYITADVVETAAQYPVQRRPFLSMNMNINREQTTSTERVAHRERNPSLERKTRTLEIKDTKSPSPSISQDRSSPPDSADYMRHASPPKYEPVLKRSTPTSPVSLVAGTGSSTQTVHFNGTARSSKDSPPSSPPGQDRRESPS